MRYLSKAKKNALRGVTLLRLDFNTPGEWRMEASCASIRFLLENECKIVILSHRGRPARTYPSFGGISADDRKLSLKRDAQNLAHLLKKKVIFLPRFRINEIKRSIARAPLHTLFLLENVRFLKGEETDDRVLAKQLASLGSYYVNDAFAVSHRAHASVHAIIKFLPSYAGLELENEIRHLSHVMTRSQHPLVMIFGGAKARDKLPVIKYFRTKADSFLVSGVLSNTILHAKGIGIGNSVYDVSPDPVLYKIAEYPNLYLPLSDYKVRDDVISDVGPGTVRLFASIIRKARTVIWSGPMGKIENPGFEQGTIGIARAIAANQKAFSVVGGGETVALLEKYGFHKKMGFISTGGGAMLDFLAGEKLPGIEALKNKK